MPKSRWTGLLRFIFALVLVILAGARAQEFTGAGEPTAAEAAETRPPEATTAPARTTAPGSHSYNDQTQEQLSQFAAQLDALANKNASLQRQLDEFGSQLQGISDEPSGNRLQAELDLLEVLLVAVFLTLAAAVVLIIGLRYLRDTRRTPERPAEHRRGQTSLENESPSERLDRLLVGFENLRSTWQQQMKTLQAVPSDISPAPMAAAVPHEPDSTADPLNLQSDQSHQDQQMRGEEEARLQLDRKQNIVRDYHDYVLDPAKRAKFLSDYKVFAVRQVDESSPNLTADGSDPLHAAYWGIPRSTDSGVPPSIDLLVFPGCVTLNEVPGINADQARRARSKFKGIFEIQESSSITVVPAEGRREGAQSIVVTTIGKLFMPVS